MERSELQTRLKNETKGIHELAENKPVMKTFIEGGFKKEHLLRYLVNVMPLYQVVEQRLLQPHILRYPELKRSDKIQQDIDVLSADFQYEKLGSMLTPLEVTDLWLGWCWTKPKDLLKADLYTRWLADMYGGRMMAKNMAGFSNSLQFSDTQKAIANVRAIIDDKSVEVNDDDIVDETMKVFEYHTDLFTILENE